MGYYSGIKNVHNLYKLLVLSLVNKGLIDNICRGQFNFL